MLTLRNWNLGAAAQRMGMRRSSRQLVVIGLLLCQSACGDDSDDKDSQAAAGSDAKGGRGGSGGGGGKSGAGGSSAGRSGELPRVTSQNDSAYMCKPKPEDSGGTGRKDSRCCAGMGVCSADVGEAASHGFPHDTCSSEQELRCLPNMRELAAASGDSDAGAPMAFASCRVQFPGAPANAPDYEGRCLPSCFAKGSPIAARLSQGTCAAGEQCAPCFDPLTGASTGSCELQGDKPKEKAPEAFGDCAGGLGYCVPAFAAGMQASQLTQLTCKQGELCGPKNKVADPNACFAHCNTGMFGPGACVPEFLASVGTGFLSKADCEDGMLCGPCEIFGMRTGICD